MERERRAPVPRLLLRSCSLNVYTKVLTNGNSSTSRVSVQIFSLVDLSVIYLHCQVQVCAQLESDSCVPVSGSISTIAASSGLLLPGSSSCLFPFRTAFNGRLDFQTT